MNSHYPPPMGQALCWGYHSENYNPQPCPHEAGSTRGLRMWFILVNVTCELKKNLFLLCWMEYSTNVNRQSWLIMLFRSTISLLISLPVWSVSYRHKGVKFPTLIIDLSIFPPVIYHNYHWSVATSLCFQQLPFQISKYDQIGLFVQISGWTSAL